MGFTLVQTFKIEESKRLIRTMLKSRPRPCVLWSGGKDSMVLLDLVRNIYPEIEVLCWREPWLPEKQVFVNRIIQEWKLVAWDYPPESVSLCKGNGRIDVLNKYTWGARPLMLARGTERPIKGKPWLCGKDTFVNRPLQKFPVPFGVAFHGHKSTDVDPLSGTMPLETDVMDSPSVVITVFPLRHWSDEDIFAYSEANGVPIDESRYRKVVYYKDRERHEKWEVLPYQDGNPDYYPACFKCLDPDEGDWVHCPKLNAQINNISSYVRWEKPQMSYCNLRTKEESKDAIQSRG